MIEHQLRQTGRTTKLFEKAINYSKNQKVYFVVHQPEMKNFQELSKDYPNLIIIGHNTSGLDYQRLQLKGQKDIVIFDHYVLYLYYSKILNHYFGNI